MVKSCKLLDASICSVLNSEGSYAAYERYEMPTTKAPTPVPTRKITRGQYAIVSFSADCDNYMALDVNITEERKETCFDWCDSKASCNRALVGPDGCKLLDGSSCSVLRKGGSFAAYQRYELPITKAPTPVPTRAVGLGQYAIESFSTDCDSYFAFNGSITGKDKKTCFGWCDSIPSCNRVLLGPDGCKLLDATSCSVLQKGGPYAAYTRYAMPPTNAPTASPSRSPSIFPTRSPLLRRLH